MRSFGTNQQTTNRTQTRASHRCLNGLASRAFVGVVVVARQAVALVGIAVDARGETLAIPAVWCGAVRSGEGWVEVSCEVKIRAIRGKVERFRFSQVRRGWAR